MTIAAQPANLGLRNFAALWRAAARTSLVLAFLVGGGAFSLQLSGLDPHAPVGAHSASTRSQIAIGLAFALLLLCGAKNWRRGLRLLRANAILLALPALAILSTLWAPEPMVALRRALAFTATMLCGFAVVTRMPGSSALRFLAQVAGAGVVLSLVYRLAAPAYGVHQLTDGVQNVHAGDWRGLFVHRTALGQLSALSLALAVYTGRTALGNRATRACVLIASIVCLIGAHSGGGWVSAALLLATPWLFTAARWAFGRGRLIGAAFAAAGVIFVVLIAPKIALLGLHLLHKDASLTGRTELWRLMLRAATDKPIWGYGYSTGFRDVVAKVVDAHSGFGYVPNAQNGYLDIALNLGLVGLAFALATMALVFWRAGRIVIDRGWKDGLPLAPLLIFVFIAELNLIEAAMISANDIFVLIYTTAFIASGDLLKSAGTPNAVCFSGRG